MVNKAAAVVVRSAAALISSAAAASATASRGRSSMSRPLTSSEGKPGMKSLPTSMHMKTKSSTTLSSVYLPSKATEGHRRGTEGHRRPWKVRPSPQCTRHRRYRRRPERRADGASPPSALGATRSRGRRSRDRPIAPPPVDGRGRAWKGVEGHGRVWMGMEGRGESGKVHAERSSDWSAS